MWPLGPGLLFEAAIMPEPTYRCSFASPTLKRFEIRSALDARCRSVSSRARLQGLP
jgi:hypothetical protein